MSWYHGIKILNFKFVSITLIYHIINLCQLDNGVIFQSIEKWTLKSSTSVKYIDELYD